MTMASFWYSITIMFLEPPPSIPPRPVILSRGLSSMTLARLGLSVWVALASRYWLATRLASWTACFWARKAAPRLTDRPVAVCPPLFLRTGGRLAAGLGLLFGLFGF